MKKFKTDKKESIKTKFKRLLFNFFPAYRRTGGKVCFISDDFQEIHIKLSLNWRTKNYVGSVFGGSLYGSVDPIYMIQLIHILGNKYVVWDKEAYIKFKRPVKKTVYANFKISDSLLDELKNKIKQNKETEINLHIQLEDSEGIIYALIDKLIYIADKEFYKQKHGSPK